MDEVGMDQSRATVALMLSRAVRMQDSAHLTYLEACHQVEMLQQLLDDLQEDE